MAGMDGAEGIRGRFLNIPLQDTLACRLEYLRLNVQVFGDENNRVHGLKLIKRGDVDVIWNGGREVSEAAPELVDGSNIFDPKSLVNTWAETFRDCLQCLKDGSSTRASPREKSLQLAERIGGFVLGPLEESDSPKVSSNMHLVWVDS